MTYERPCESCGRAEASALVDFGDGGRVFHVCERCVDPAIDHGCVVVTTDQLEVTS